MRTTKSVRRYTSGTWCPENAAILALGNAAIFITHPKNSFCDLSYDLFCYFDCDFLAIFCDFCSNLTILHFAISKCSDFSAIVLTRAFSYWPVGAQACLS